MFEKFLWTILMDIFVFYGVGSIIWFIFMGFGIVMKYDELKSTKLVIKSIEIKYFILAIIFMPMSILTLLAIVLGNFMDNIFKSVIMNKKIF